MTNPLFSVRFYIRTRSFQKDDDTPTTLKARVWVGATKSFLYLTTQVSMTNRTWKLFRPDGTTKSISVDPTLVKQIDCYRAAIQLVMSAAIANNRIDTLTSDELNRRVDAIATHLLKRQKDDTSAMLVYATPANVTLCRNCKFFGEKCQADWGSETECSLAPDMAAYTKDCSKFSADKNSAKSDVFDRLIAFYLMARSNKPHLSSNDALGSAVDMLAHLRYNPDKTFQLAKDALKKHKENLDPKARKEGDHEQQ